MTFQQFALRNVVRNRRAYAAFFMASVFSVMVFFLFSMLLFHPSIENRFLREIAFFGMGISEVILYVFTLFFLFYSMRAFLQARSTEFGVLIQLGMSNKQLNRLIFIETMFIGVAAIIAGLFFGLIFTKFFFMLVREIVAVPSLPFYLSWKPFALTIGAFVSSFVLIAIIAPRFIKKAPINELVQEETETSRAEEFSSIRATLGLFLLAAAYTFALTVQNTHIIAFILYFPPLLLIGTYLFFTDTLPFLFEWLRQKKSFYWRHFYLLSVTEGIIRLKENARMFFIVTIVSTVAFMSVGVLASLTSFASQYRAVNPLGLVYKSEPNNPYEWVHVGGLVKELEEEGIDYELIRMRAYEQQSTATRLPVTIIDEQPMNVLARLGGKETHFLKRGEAVFLPPTASAEEKLRQEETSTWLEPAHIPVHIKGSYSSELLPANAIGTNAIVLNHYDFTRLEETLPRAIPNGFTYYAFVISDWQRTETIGRVIEETYAATGMIRGLPFTFDNPGANYAILRMTFSLLLFIGLLLAGVLFLAAGSFIYFRLYTSLDRERREFSVLKRLGMTTKEFKKVVNRQLIPQFFFPWGIALMHSAFAFFALQKIWETLAEISIAKEMILVLAGFTLLQYIYFYLIRWRYLVHVTTPR